MRVGRRSVLLVGMLAAAGAASLVFLTRDRREITELLDGLARAATRPDSRSKQVLRDGLEPEIGVSFYNEAQERRDRDELLELWHQAAAKMGPLFVELRELEISIDGDAARAHGEALVSQSQHDDIHARVHRFVAHVRKTRDRWRLSALSVEDGSPALPEARP